MHEITRFDYDGNPLFAQRQGNGLWFTADELVGPLGVKDRRVVINLYNDHRDEFTEAESTIISAMTVDGKRRRVRAFSPLGAEHLALLAKNAKGRAFRRWVLDKLLAPVNAGARVVTEEQMRAVVESLESRHEKQIAFLTEVVLKLSEQNAALTGLANVQASNSGRLLSYLAHNPEVRAALVAAREQEEIDKGQNVLPGFTPRFPTNGNGGTK